MKNLALMPIAAAMLMVVATGTLAQNNTPPATTVEQPTTAKQPNTNSGTSPAEMGATGWTGATRGQTQDSATVSGPGASARDTEAAKDQPAMATGADLKGPSAQFPANKTPE
ncbi:MAG: hypothetical protein H7316_14925 [Tardiphaga sp.]|nr:hypothetical protein [Tardiphaga sp.]